MSPMPSVRAIAFTSRIVYRSHQTPGYTSWASFFQGTDGTWYITCEEVTKPDTPLPAADPDSWLRMGLPVAYDKSPFLMEAVILASKDEMQTWTVVSRQPYRHHHSIGQFGTTRTTDGRFLRFLWTCYDMTGMPPNAILDVSHDGGKTWERQEPLHDAHFCSYPHRLRTLRDGTLVLCLPLQPVWGNEKRPLRTCSDPYALGDVQMTLIFSFDEGRSWSAPLPVYGGQNVSETDFVELPDGHLLLINNSIFANPGRQFVYRDGHTFTPGPMEAAQGKIGFRDPNMVPETICMTNEGMLVGCMRAGTYAWSDDLGLTWHPLNGIPDRGPEVYQPWIYALPDGDIVCVGHYGRDAPITGDDRDDQYICLHRFRLDGIHQTLPTRIRVERAYDADRRRWPNRYTMTLLAGEEPLRDKTLAFWFVERGAPGYDSFGKETMETRMQSGGQTIQVKTDASGQALVSLPHLDTCTDPHHSIQFMVLFNQNGEDPTCKPARTTLFEQYALAYMEIP